MGHFVVDTTVYLAVCTEMMNLKQECLLYNHAYMLCLVMSWSFFLNLHVLIVVDTDFPATTMHALLTIHASNT